MSLRFVELPQKGKGQWSVRVQSVEILVDLLLSALICIIHQIICNTSFVQKQRVNWCSTCYFEFVIERVGMRKNWEQYSRG